MLKVVLSAQSNCCLVFFTAKLGIPGFCKRKINQQTEIFHVIPAWKNYWEA